MIFVDFSQAQPAPTGASGPIGEDINPPTITIPEVNQLRGVEFVSPQKVNGTKQPTVIRRTGFRLPTIGEAVQILGQNIKEATRNLKNLVTPEPKQSLAPPVTAQAPKPVSAPQVSPEPEPKTAAVIRAIISEPQPVSRPVASVAPSPNLFEEQLNNLKLSLATLEKNQNSQYLSLLTIVGQAGKISSLGYAGSPSSLKIGSPTLDNPDFTGTATGLADDDIPNDITLESSAGGSFGGNVTITGILKVGTGTITVNGTTNIISSSGGLTLQPSSGNALTTSYLNATSTATSTFAGPISATTTTGDGALIVSGATTTGRLLLNPYGGRVGVGTTSPSDTFAISGNLYVSGATTTLRNIAYRWPSADGASGQVLQTSGAGDLSWGTGSQWVTSGANVYYATGNVGIGTTTPTAVKLHIAATTSPQLVLSDMNGGADLKHVYASSSAGALAFGILNDALSTYTERFRITNAGNVGIGTTSPYASLSVVGATGVVAGLYSATSTTATSTFLGAVGVGTSTPAERLAVAGRLYVGGAGTSTIENNLHIRGNLQTGTGTLIITSNTLQSLSGDFTLQSAGGASLVLNTGMVGVGSTTPWAKFSVEQGTTSPVFVVSDQGTSTPHLLVSGLGRVGVGTTSPSDTFAISGNLYVSGATTTLRNVTYRWPSADGASGQVLQTSGAGDLSWGTGSQWVTSGANVYYATGNVGIGTTTPTAVKLHIAATTSPQLVLSDMNGGADLKHVYASSSAGALAFGILNDALSTYTERFRITNAGNVGIGTTSPSGLLSVEHTAGNIGLAVGSSTATNFIVNANGNVGIKTHTPRHNISPTANPVLDITSPAGSGVSVLAFHDLDSTQETQFGTDGAGMYIDVAGHATAANNDIIFRVTNSNSSFSMTEAMRVHNDATVGIGTGATIPSSFGSVPKLGISTAATTIVGINGGGGASDAFLSFSNGDADKWLIGTRGTNGPPVDHFGIFDKASNEVLSILQSGSIGIGTTTPTSLFQLATTTASGAQLVITDPNGGTNLKHVYASSTQGVLAFGILNDALTTYTERLRITNAGNVGIGTSTPVSTLSIQGSLCVRDTGSCGTGAGEIYTTSGNVVSIDVAENYPALDESIEAGDIVALSSQIFSYANPSDFTTEETIGSLIKARSGQIETLLGAISTKPGLLFGYDIKDVPVRPVTLSGRVPVKVNLESGEIKTGDPITSSSEPGVGMKATKAGKIIGYALEPFDEQIANSKAQSGKCSERALGDTRFAICKILTFINLSYWMPLELAENENLTADPAGLLAQLITAIEDWLKNAIVYIKELVVEKLTTKKLCIGETCINEAQLKELLSGVNGQMSDVDVDAQSNVNGQMSIVDTEPPVITLNGNNPTQIEVGVTYVDLGATVTDSDGAGNVNDNLSIYYQVDGVPTANDGREPPGIDTSAPGAHTITYTATDQAGNTGTATRQVIVSDPNPSPQPLPPI